MFKFKEDTSPVTFRLSERTYAGLLALQKRIEDESGKKMTQDELICGLVRYALITRRKEEDATKH